jgi:polysaccharide biosynthesis protein VpsM
LFDRDIGVLMNKNGLTLAITLALSSAAIAQDGTGVQTGPFRVKPTIGLTVGHDSNVAQTNTNEIDSFYTRVSPGIRFDSGNESRSFSLAYELDAARYQDSSDDNYTDHRLNAGAVLSPTVRTKIDLNASYERGHDRRGTNSRQGLQTAINSAGTPIPVVLDGLPVDRWERKGLDVGFNYGAPGARGALGLSAGVSNLDYSNNESYSQAGNRDLQYLEGRFGWRLAPKTQLYVSAREANIDYDRARRSNGARLDSNERTYFVGLQFDATAKTSGHVGVGRTKKDFDDSRIRGYSGVAWDVGLQFRPRTYSVIDLSASRGTQEAVNFIGGFSDTDFLVNRGVTLAWTHGWSDRFHTGVDIGRENLDYRFAGNTIRDDALNFWGLSADYKLRDWLSLGAGFRSYSREADVDNAGTATNQLYDFDRDEFSVSFEASL